MFDFLSMFMDRVLEEARGTDEPMEATEEADVREWVAN